ncbi:MAG: tetratricopeptide repeat protein [Lacipirellulaceae bacterium]
MRFLDQRTLGLLTLVALLTLGEPLSPPAHAQALPGWLPGVASDDPEDQPGGRRWWRKHKKQKVYVPSEGYQVPGFDGYFDENGKPMPAPVDEIVVKLDGDPEEDGGLIPGLDPKKAAGAVKEAMGLGPNEQLAQQFLDRGVTEFQGGKLDAAAESFEKAAARWPGSQIEAQALFNRAEALYFDKHYKGAADAYVKLLDEHPSTPRLDATIERLWEIGQYWEREHFTDSYQAPLDFNATEPTRPWTDTIGNAVKVYEAIRLNDPTGPRADDAIMATAGIYFRRERFHDADYHYGLLRQEYPRSEHQFDAHVLGLQSILRKYQGADYDGQPLAEAKRLESRIRANFSGNLSSEERDRLRDVRAQLAASIEERDLKMAEYYANVDQNRSAKVYFEKVLKEHPESPAADVARERLAAVKELPETPDVPLEWFVEIFPQNQERAAIDGIEEVAPAAVAPQVAAQPQDAAATTVTR